MKKIQVFYNNHYLFTTEKYNTIKELKNKLENNEGDTIIIHSVPNYAHIIDNIKKYKFEIIEI